MASAAKNTAPADIQAPSGFSEGGTPDVDGWYKPEIGKTVHGKVVGHMRINGENGKRDVALIKLIDDCMGYQKGDDTGAMLKQGQILGLGISHDIRDVLHYVENQGYVHLTPVEKKKLGKKSMWKFKQFYKGIKAALTAPIETSAGSAGTGDDDDIPF
jgi:hypothetical protein